MNTILSEKGVTSLLTSGLCALLIANSASAQDGNPAPHRERTIERFAFLPDIFIDLGSGLEHNRRLPSDTSIADCENDQYNCLTSPTFQVVWPKNCLRYGNHSSYQLGDTWTRSFSDTRPGITSTVIGSFVRSEHLRASTHYLVRTHGLADRLYILRPDNGLVGVIQDPRSRGTLAQAALNEHFLSELASGRQELSDGYFVSYLVGLGNVGECD